MRTQDDLREAVALSARLRYIAGKPGKISSPDWFDRQWMTDRLIELGVCLPQVPA